MNGCESLERFDTCQPPVFLDFRPRLRLSSRAESRTTLTTDVAGPSADALPVPGAACRRSVRRVAKLALGALLEYCRPSAVRFVFYRRYITAGDRRIGLFRQTEM